MEGGSHDGDLAVVFFAGHGALIDGRSFLLPSDVDGHESRIEATAIDLDWLKDKLDKIARWGRVLLLIDACHSGASTTDGVKFMIDSSALRTALASVNVNVLTSSSRSELSFEDQTWKHGAFTKVLLDALVDPDTDLNRNGLISMAGLASYVTDRVIALTNETQHPDAELRYLGTVFAHGRLAE